MTTDAIGSASVQPQRVRLVEEPCQDRPDRVLGPAPGRELARDREQGSRLALPPAGEPLTVALAAGEATDDGADHQEQCEGSPTPRGEPRSA